MTLNTFIEELLNLKEEFGKGNEELVVAAMTGMQAAKPIHTIIINDTVINLKE